MSDTHIIEVSADEYILACRGAGNYARCNGILLHEMRPGYVEGMARYGTILQQGVFDTKEQAIETLEKQLQKCKGWVNKYAEQSE